MIVPRHPNHRLHATGKRYEAGRDVELLQAHEFSSRLRAGEGDAALSLAIALHVAPRSIDGHISSFAATSDKS